MDSKLLDIRQFLAAFLISGFFASSTAAEITDEDLVSMLGESEAYRVVFQNAQEAVRNDDRERFASLVHYPFSVYRMKEKCCGSDVVDTTENAREFEEKFDEIVTPDVRTLILNQDFDDLHLSWRGLGFKLGSVWIVGYCVGPQGEDECEITEVGIGAVHADAAKIALNSTE